MAGQLSRFQTRGFTSWKGTTRRNALSAIFQRQPQRASNLMVQLLAYRRGKSLESFLNQFPTKEFDDDNEYYWEAIGSSRKNIALLEARDEFGNVVTADTSYFIGKGTAPFYLVFGEDWFSDGEFIVGNLNELYQFRVLGDARTEGSRCVYKVELAGGNTEGCPPERLLAGERFSIEAAFVEQELSRKVGDIHFAAPVAMRNEWSTVRLYHKVAGSELNQKLEIGIPVVQEQADGSSKTAVQNMWMHYVDMQFEEEFSESKNRAIAFGRSNRNKNNEYTNIGKSGVAIKTGAGLFEQMEYSNTIFYNEFSLKVLLDALSSLSVAKLTFKDRHFLIRTGEYGARQFHEAVLKNVSGWTPFMLDNSSLGVVQRSKSELNSTTLSAGFQFTEWRAPNGVVVTVQTDSGLYDDPYRNKIPHPDGGLAMSRRYDIMDMGEMDQPNIFKCAIKGMPEVRSYQWGLRNPFTGQMGNPYMSYDEDSASIHKMSTFGVCVLDPTRTLSLIPAILQG